MIKATRNILVKYTEKQHAHIYDRGTFDGFKEPSPVLMACGDGIHVCIRGVHYVVFNFGWLLPSLAYGEEAGFISTSNRDWKYTFVPACDLLVRTKKVTGGIPSSAAGRSTDAPGSDPPPPMSWYEKEINETRAGTDFMLNALAETLAFEYPGEFENPGRVMRLLGGAVANADGRSGGIQSFQSHFQGCIMDPFHISKLTEKVKPKPLDNSDRRKELSRLIDGVKDIFPSLARACAKHTYTVMGRRGSDNAASVYRDYLDAAQGSNCFLRFTRCVQHRTSGQSRCW
jgi:hypothetical protein